MLFGVVSFPGMNCETESVRALKNVGFDSRVILWNEPESAFLECDGIFVPGGFSYEDRGRSGVVSANDHAIDAIRKVAQAGKPVIGICNGAQVLVESGLVTDSETPKVALTINKRVKHGEVQGVGFYHDWCYLKNIAQKGRSPFNNIDKLVKTPLAHGEGRFVIPADLYEEMKANDQIVYLYTDEEGNVDEHYPVNPNGSFENIAGICNKQGNVFAMMPHPERDAQSAELFFGGVAEWMKTNNVETHSNASVQTEKTTVQIKVSEKPQFKVELFIQTIITDNDCETIRSALERKIGDSIELKRLRYFGINLEGDVLAEAAKIVETDELANVNKEVVYAKVGGDYFKYAKGSGFVAVDQEELFEPKSSGSNLQSCSNTSKALFAVENEDILAKAKQPKLQHEGIQVTEIHSAICWIFPAEMEDKVIETGILANPVSMHLVH